MPQTVRERPPTCGGSSGTDRGWPLMSGACGPTVARRGPVFDSESQPLSKSANRCSGLFAGRWCGVGIRAGTLGELRRTVTTETRTEPIAVGPLRALWLPQWLLGTLACKGSWPATGVPGEPAAARGLAVINRGDPKIGPPYWHADGTMNRVGRHQEAVPHRRHVRTRCCLI
jgi:hypothetical protein